MINPELFNIVSFIIQNYDVIACFIDLTRKFEELEKNFALQVILQIAFSK